MYLKNSLLLSAFLFIVTMIDKTTSKLLIVIGKSCSDTTMFTNGSTYENNLNTLFTTLASNASDNPSGYHQAIVGNPETEAVYGHYLCHGDANTHGCHHCVIFATTSSLPKECPNRKTAMIYHYKCTVRYSNVSFFHKMDHSFTISQIGGNITKTVENTTQFTEILGNTFDNVIAIPASQAGPFKKYANVTANFSASESIFRLGGLGQCTPDLNPSDCHRCLMVSIGMFNDSESGRIFAPSCIVEYSLSYLSSSPSPSPSPSLSLLSDPNHTSGKSKRSTKVMSIIVVLAVLSAVLLAITFSIIIRRCKSKKKAAPHQTGSKDLTTHESLQYDVTTLRIATNNFSNENKLGEGGFGSVYKGTFSNGEDVAVKRLSRNSSNQGAQDFKNEILLVAKLHHRNLVTLLGFCLNEEEKLLVYEYMPNKSLDNFVFDPVKQGQLNWGLRCNIIQGIAKGMLYLHEDSGRRIIHRDLKASNILLDANMNPKIADFGLARMFGYDKSQSNTSKVAGTYGYMAPEYVKHGQYSMKSDVYSFGVLVLEIVSGKKISALYEPGYPIDLVSYAWKSWQDGKSLAFVDPSIRDSCLSHDVMRCLHLGLLCVQEAVNVRPTMVTVVLALESYSITLPAPRQPGFFNNTVGESDIVIAHSLYEGSLSLSEMEPR